MSDSPFTLFVPFGEGYGNPGLTIRADSAKELVSILSEINTRETDNPDALSLFDELLTGVETVRAGALLKFPPKEKAAPQRQNSHPQATNSDAPTCAHGPMKYREGTSKAGNQYKGYFCTAPQGTQRCDAKFIK